MPQNEKEIMERIWEGPREVREKWRGLDTDDPLKSGNVSGNDQDD
jgi:hypothetical protein